MWFSYCCVHDLGAHIEINHLCSTDKSDQNPLFIGSPQNPSHRIQDMSSLVFFLNHRRQGSFGIRYLEPVKAHFEGTN